MKIVSAGYIANKAFSNPQQWLKRIRAYAGIFEALSAKNEVVSIDQIAYEGEYFNNGVQYQFMRLNNPGSFFPVKLHRAIKKLKPDVVIIQSLHFPVQVIHLRLVLGSKTKIIVHNHAEKPFAGIKKYAQKIADKYINAYLFASKPMGMEWVEKGNMASPQKIHEVMEVSSIFYPVSKEQAITRTHVSGSPVFLWVGRLNDNKDPITVVKGFLKFAVLNPTARLYMVYHTDELLADIQLLIKASNRSDAIILVGQLPHDDLLYWFNSADFIISGSHYEGSGTAVCEAMSCGCVPVVTDILSFRMITDNGNCGILYEAGNEAALLMALKQTRQMDMQQQRQKTLAYYQSNLSFEAIAQRIQDIAASC